MRVIVEKQVVQDSTEALEESNRRVATDDPARREMDRHGPPLSRADAANACDSEQGTETKGL